MQVLRSLSRVPSETEVGDIIKAHKKKENRERKMKWRKSNVEKNKNNDLRCRVNKRANQLFGPGSSEMKKNWVDAEFNKRLEKRKEKDAMKRRVVVGNETPDTSMYSTPFNQPVATNEYKPQTCHEYIEKTSSLVENKLYTYHSYNWEESPHTENNLKPSSPISEYSFDNKNISILGAYGYTKGGKEKQECEEIEKSIFSRSYISGGIQLESARKNNGISVSGKGYYSNNDSVFSSLNINNINNITNISAPRYNDEKPSRHMRDSSECTTVVSSPHLPIDFDSKYNKNRYPSTRTEYEYREVGSPGKCSIRYITD
ncbi:hypothetical protein AX774_g7005 [Zancudomyces culisetae]|uniref:DUF3020 domain-containing protein n=1 Tax=Zancudomyces culisetae TaxID=1213189 RepID=A0A1R1PFD4_ZANCU|nr:hypothetical protein AX774_g7005 [Zancudomyces culisetae]|eukprot:OMH79572.1 hypothetical protein AX774_g7005 [Zancudomyces culisetae]